jgi:hypothetical protein
MIRGWILRQKVNFICRIETADYMYYIDDNANIIVPKSVRPIIDYEETYLGNKEGANRQFRLGTLHIREYDDHYAVHRDKIDPRTDPLGHLLLDTPEYLIGILSSVSVGRQVSDAVYSRGKAEGKKHRTALCDAITAGCLAGSAAGLVSYVASNAISKIKRSI